MPIIVTNKTYSEMAAMLAAETLDLALSYKITDRGDRGLLFRAAAFDRLESDGLRYMLCPATYAIGADAYSNDWIGVWNATKQATATTGQLCIWNGLVWVAGAMLSGGAPNVALSGWTVIPKATFTNHEYVEMIFGVTYDFENDWIRKQWDKEGNVFGISKTEHDNLFSDYTDGNILDLCDWNYSSSTYLMTMNNCHAIFNNSCLGKISGNICLFISDNNTPYEIADNDITGIISLNTNNGSIYKNRNNGSIVANSSVMGETCNIFKNSNNGDITGVWDADVTDAVVDKTGTAE